MSDPSSPYYKHKLDQYSTEKGYSNKKNNDFD